MDNLRETVAAFLASYPHCIVSTIGPDGEPQAALVAFSETPEFAVTFGTLTTTRKYANLLRDPRVAIVVEGPRAEVQLQGTARIAEGSEREQCIAMHTAKNPASAKHSDDPLQQFFIVTPSWLRYTDHETKPHTVEELRF